MCSKQLKMVQITLKGTGIIFMVEDVVTDNYIQQDAILEGVQLLKEDEDITKQKGKYIKQKYFHNMITPDTSGSIKRMVIDKTFNFTFTFDIPVEESEFNPKLIQLIKSDYEFEGIPYYIVTDKMMYDGKEICSNEGLTDFAMKGYTEEEMTWDDYQNMYIVD